MSSDNVPNIEMLTFVRDGFSTSMIAELKLLSLDQMNEILNRIDVIESLGIAAFWSPDRVDDITDISGRSAISMSPQFVLLNNLWYRVLTQLQLGGVDLNQIKENAICNLRDFHTSLRGSRTVGCADGYISYVRPIERSGGTNLQLFLDSDFIQENLWLICLYLYIVVGAHAQTRAVIQTALNNQGSKNV